MSSDESSFSSTAGVKAFPAGTAFPSGASLLYASLPLTFIAQAACLAWAVSRLQAGAGATGAFIPAACIAALALLRAAMEAWSERLLFQQAREQVGAWRAQGVSALAHRSPLDRHRMTAGAAASALTEQAEALLPWLTRYRSASLRARLIPVCILLPVAALSWTAALILLAAAPLIPLFMAIVGWRAHEAGKAHWAELSDMHAYLLDRLRGLPTLRALDAVDRSALRLRAQGEALREKSLRVLRIAFLSSAVLELFSALGVAMVAVYIGFHLLGHLNFGTWGAPLTLGEGLFILLLAPAFFEPLRELSAVWHDRATGEAAIDTMTRVCSTGLMLPDVRHEAAAAASSCPPGVTLRGLHFHFPGQPPLFTDLDLDIAPGEHLALVGDSGAGKSVLLALIGGLLTPQQGRITFPGTSAGHPPRLGWMEQRPHVFAATVGRNVSLDRDGIGADAVQHALATANLGHVPQAHSQHTLGEQGRGLSAGEIRRLGLARLAADPGLNILLVDEPTANLDRDSAEEAIRHLLALAQGRTLIVATHDPALIRCMDRVVRIGTHPEAAA